MSRFRVAFVRSILAVIQACSFAIGAAAVPRAARAQDADPLPPKRDSTTFPSLGAGEFTPSTGYDIIKTQRGSLNISVYGLFRYMNQYPAGDSFTDHLGRVRPVNRRNDLNW